MTTTAEPPVSDLPPPPPPRRLERTPDDRMLAGVAGGLGRYTGIDPVVFRVVLAVLAVFGGAGIAIYIVAWVLMPEQGKPPRSSPNVWGIVAAVLAAAFLVAVISDGHGHGLVALLVLGGLGYLIYRNQTEGGTPPPGGWPSTATTWQPTPPAWQPTAPAAGQAPPSWSSGQWPTPPPPREPRPRSILTGLTISALLVVAGLGVALDRADVLNVTWQGMLATLLVLSGVGLVIGTWLGRARGLIAVGIVLALATGVASVVRVPLHGGAGERLWSPTSVSDIDSPYRLGVGEAELDLTDVDFTRSTRVVASLGAGSLKVYVPDDVNVVVRARAGAGELRLLGRQTDGTRIDETVRASAPGGADTTVTLDLKIGLGEVEVRRAAS